MFRFYTSWESQKTKGFLTFSRGMEIKRWAKIGLYFKYFIIYIIAILQILTELLGHHKESYFLWNSSTSKKDAQTVHSKCLQQLKQSLTTPSYLFS